MQSGEFMSIVKADKASFDVRTQMSEIFADGFTQWLGFFFQG